jgi:hypothetical protein
VRKNPVLESAEALDAHQGYNFRWRYRVFLDPNDAGKIYIAIFGGSVWHGPAAGDPKALEDIVAPVPAAQ